MSNLKKIDAFVFEGGGTLGTAYCGALLEFVKTYGDLSGVKKFAGSSVGSLVAAVLAAGASPLQLYNVMMAMDFKKFEDDSWTGVIGDGLRLINDYGIYKGDALEKFAEEQMFQFTGVSCITFAQLYAYNGNELVITGTNLNRRCTIYFNRFKFPNMVISQALRISSSFPIFFKACKFMGDIWADGGILNNYPLSAFDYPPYSTTGPSATTLGFKLMGASDIDYYVDPSVEHADEDLPPRVNITNVIGFASTLVSTLYEVSQRVNMTASDGLRTCVVNIGDKSALDFNLTLDDKLQLAGAGAAAFRIWLQGNGVPQIPAPAPLPDTTRGS